MLLNRVFNFLASLRLTVVCLFLAMVLVFVGTLAQVRLGLYVAQQDYFRSMLVFWGPEDAGWKIPVFPGGYLLGVVLLLNLLAAHAKRFKLSRKKAGIFMVHAGLILLLIGQFASEVLSTESAMRLSEGEAKNYSQSFRSDELVFIDKSAPDKDTVSSVPASKLEDDKEFAVPGTPFKVHVRQFWPNSDLVTSPVEGAVATGVTNGIGAGIFVVGKPETAKMDERNLPSAVLEIVTPKGSLGTWLVSSEVGRRQSFDYEGRTYEVALRFLRHYKSYSIRLLDFQHDKYKGTEKPKNFSSRIQIENPATSENREVLIYMNNPLRYNGETYYQGSFDPKDDRVSILQVVRNPGWLTPYVACSLVGLGLLVQFLSHLIGFIKKRRPV